MSSAFGNLRKTLSQSDYIKQKQSCNIYLKSEPRLHLCTFKSPTSSAIISDKVTLPCAFSMRKGLKTDLATVCTVSNIFPYIPPSPDTCCEKCPNNNEPVIINSTTTFYKQYMIDPFGQLFGNTPCGILNYTKYMI